MIVPAMFLGARLAGHFGGPVVDYFSATYHGDAASALADLDDR